MSKKLEALQYEIRAVLTGSKEGIREEDFPRVYESLCCKALPFQEFNFASSRDLIKSMTDIVQVRKIGGNNFYYEIPNQETEHISKLVQGQKNTGGKKGAKTAPEKKRKVKNSVLSMKTFSENRSCISENIMDIFLLCSQKYKCLAYTAVNQIDVSDKNVVVKKVNGELYKFCLKKVKNNITDDSKIDVKIFSKFSPLITELKCLLQMFPSGLDVEEVPREYQKEYNKSLNVMKYGFLNEHDFFSHLLYIFRIKTIDFFFWKIHLESEALNPEKSIPSEDFLPSESIERSKNFVEVIIGNVVNPGEFFVFQKPNTTLECRPYYSYLYLIHLLFEKDENTLTMEKSEVKPGRMVMIFDQSLLLWLRAEVTEECGLDKLSVFFLDVGMNSTDLSIDCFRRPTELISSLKRLAILARCEDIQPYKLNQGWSSKSTEEFKRLTSRNILAKFIKKGEDGIPELILMDKLGYNNGKTTTINQIMVKKNMAVSISANASLIEEITETVKSGDSDIKLRRFIFPKQGLIHGIPKKSVKKLCSYEDEWLVSSAEISNLFRRWKRRDILSVMLAHKNVSVSFVDFQSDQSPGLFNYCRDEKIPGFEKDIVALFDIKDVVHIINLFGMKEEQRAAFSLKNILKNK